MNRPLPPRLGKPHDESQLAGFVLVIDDDPLIRRFVRRLLNRANIPHRLAADGREALEVITADPYRFSVVLSDFLMPGVDGISVLQDVAMAAPWASRVLVSGQLELDDALAAINSGTTFQIVTKPLDGPQLLALIRKAHDRAAIAQRNAQRLATLQAENAALTQANLRLQAELTGTTDALLDALSITLDLRHGTTIGRSRRVAAYARRLGEALRLAPDRLATVERAALLRDIATVGAPDRLLAPALPLSPEERFELHTHQQQGAALLEQTDVLRDAGRAIRHLAERVDGAGPLGVRGDAIPVEARVVRLARVLDELTSPDGAPSRGWAWAREEIRRQAGAVLDPTVVRAYETVTDTEWAALQAASASVSSESSVEHELESGL